MTAASNSAPAMPGEWAAEGIEQLGACPVCGSKQRDIMLSALRDRIFNTAAGAWDLQRCRDCESGYLDPRPTSDTIHLAYLSYHTHETQVSLPADELRGRRWLERVLANGYKNWRYGTKLAPASGWGALVGLLLPTKRAILDRQFRGLQRRADGGRVLDVGCGDAAFLQNAKLLGWQTVGTDFDPVVVENARTRGLDVRLGTVDEVEGPFDVITMSHVVEHLHDPVAVLRQCHDLLAPGGLLWIETPNVEALGLRRFGADWRGLEPPRHLVLFSNSSLKRALRETGFVTVKYTSQPNAVTGIYEMSEQVRRGADPYAAHRSPIAFQIEMTVVKLIEWLSPRRREFIAMTARKAS